MDRPGGAIGGLRRAKSEDHTAIGRTVRGTPSQSKGGGLSDEWSSPGIGQVNPHRRGVFQNLAKAGGAP
jgi:hypothetical protein